MANNPFDQFDDPVAPQTVTIGVRDPAKVRAEERAQDAAARSAAAAERQAEASNRAAASTERQIANSGKDYVLKLSQDYNGDPTVKAYRTAIQQFGQALGTGTGPQADLALTYAFAKAMDPESVVRESEQGMVTSSQPWFQATVERVKKQFGMDEAGNFTPEARTALRKQISNSVAQRVKLYEARRDYFEKQAQALGADPSVILGAHDAAPFVPAIQKWVAEANGAPDGQRAEDETAKAAGFTDNSPPALPPANQGGNNPTPWDGPNADRQMAASGGYRFVDDPRTRSTIASLINAGAGYGTVAAAAKKAGGTPLSLQQFNAVKAWMKANPGKEYPASAVEAGSYQPLNMMQKVAGSPAGAFTAQMANAATAGTVGALAGERGKGALDAMAAMNPNASMAGSLVGGITGAMGAEAALAARAPAALANFAPRAADAAYGALYGFNDAADGEGVQGAAMGAGAGLVGGILGDRAMRVAGGAIKGVTNPAAEYLKSRGVPLTAGQVTGGILKSMEDKATSIPFVGDVINARRAEGLDAFNRAAFADAGQTIAAVPQNIGKEGVDELLGAASDAYDNATAGVRVPLDDEFMADIARARAAGQQLPPDLAARYERAIANRVDPLLGPLPNYSPAPSSPRPIGTTNDNSPLTGAAENLEGLLTDPRPTSALYQRGDFLTHNGQLGTVRGSNDASVTVTFSDGDRIIPRNDPGLSVAPADMWPSPGQTAYARPELTGEQYQQAVRGLKSYRAEMTKPGFEQDYRDALGAPIDALRGVMERGGGQSVVDGLAKADSAYRNTKILQDAVERAKGGGTTGEIGMFTPNQLQSAVSKSAKKFPGGTPLEELADMGQRVLPSRIADSGTPGRLAQLAIPGAVGGAVGGGTSLATGDAGTGTATGLGAMIALALGGSKVGQKALTQILLERPDVARRIGGAITRNSQIGGWTGAGVLTPLAVGSQ